MKVKYNALTKVGLQMIIYLYRAHACRCAREDNIARLDGKETAYVTDDTVHTVQHISSITALDGMPIDIEMEMQILHLSHLCQWHPLAHCRTAVKALTYIPRQTILAQLLLQVTCSEIYSYRDLIIVPVCESFGNTSSQMVDANHQFRFIFTLLGIIGDEKGLPTRQQSRVRLSENDWVFI